MASRIFLLCLLVLCLTVTNIECKYRLKIGRLGGSHRRFSLGALFGSSSSHSWGSSSSSGYGSKYLPTYYTMPQYVYIQDYRNSDSRYGDLLTGLSLYNLGRSHSHYHDHYYYDDYYRHRYGGSSYDSSYTPQNKPQDEANCVLKVKENGREEALKIPCEIVSTFTQDSKKEVPTQPIQVNKTAECTTNITNIPVPVTTTSTTTTTTASPFDIPPDILYSYKDMKAYMDSLSDMIGPDGNMIMPSMSTRRPRPPVPPNNVPVINVTTETFSVNGSVSYITKTVITNATMVNVTVCTINSTFVDPLTAKGAPVDPNNMECAVEILTKEASLRTVVDCKILMKYAKMPEPKRHIGILPPREKLKTWLDNPPWWMSLFIAV
ncbi:uncharacterized protein LOC126912201 [Spodoptera frugiperda]|uniref:Uncharacterized protein LOC126912201 n=1 Tax=Spodoptera frugiperda TaxID=7108 RepID=A0A9R0E5I3_SPOFR|nr:uncharacterized protein LOC126912201 [Spodoptera frugiperda]